MINGNGDPWGNWVDPRGSEMPGPKLARMGVPSNELSLQRTLQRQAEDHHMSVDGFVQSVAAEPQAFIRPNALRQASCLRLSDDDQLAVIDKFPAHGMQDATIKQVVASLALHAAIPLGLTAR